MVDKVQEYPNLKEHERPMHVDIDWNIVFQSEEGYI